MAAKLHCQFRKTDTVIYYYRDFGMAQAEWFCYKNLKKTRI